MKCNVPLDLLHKVFETNFFAQVALTETLLPLIKKSSAGRIVNLSSILGSLTLHADPKSPINKFNVPTTCAKCHANVKAEYMQSIHGTAVQRGNWQAPVCTDCHGIHTIKAPKDANSSVAAANVAGVRPELKAAVKTGNVC